MIAKAIKLLNTSAFTWAMPIVKLASGEDIKQQLVIIWNKVGMPTLAIVLFLMLWSFAAKQVDTSLGVLPGPAMVYSQAKVLWQEHVMERTKASEFYTRQDVRNAAILQQNPDAVIHSVSFPGKATYIDQIVTSLKTVFMGFVIASIIALPIGVICGSSEKVMTALNPIIQILKPVSPLAWLPIVTMVISAVYTTSDGWFEKSFIISALTVSLCSLWPTLLNTAMGVSSVNPDYINVAKVLQLSPVKRTTKVVLPATLPLIFTGLRISLGVGWMVLIAAEMLAQNPGLGKFVWDEFQNGSSDSLARIMVAVVTIGLIGFLLDQLMVVLQRAVSFE